MTYTLFLIFFFLVLHFFYCLTGLKKKSHRNLLTSEYFLVGTINFFRKIGFEKKNSQLRANDANQWKALGGGAGGGGGGRVEIERETSKVNFNLVDHCL